MNEFINKTTRAVLIGEEFLMRFDGFMLPDKPEPHQLEGTVAGGWAIIETDPQPPGDFLSGEVREEDGHYIRGWIPVELSAEQWADRIAARRWLAETSGTTVDGTTVDGMPIDTGRDSQGLITGAALAAMLDPAYSVRWKTVAGFVDLTAQQIIGVASAVRAFVQASFDREAVLLGAVADGSITAEMLEEGWP